MKRLRRGLVFKAHRLVYHSTLGLRVIQKKGAGPLTTELLPRTFSDLTMSSSTPLLVAEVLVGLAMDTTVYLSWRWERVKSTS